ncbi:12918_t:CDS:2 [Ambispora leptoticha]|uniref:12918_t:CDS:1 n=1 Tax=Ambispora leptoticha TaxID=144679 RepID=A0A9N9HDL1_9GLOM|nr:12918_t:CDS:2 [Ambispora leptoticha]
MTPNGVIFVKILVVKGKVTKSTCDLPEIIAKWYVKVKSNKQRRYGEDIWTDVTWLNLNINDKGAFVASVDVLGYNNSEPLTKARSMYGEYRIVKCYLYYYPNSTVGHITKQTTAEEAIRDFGVRYLGQYAEIDKIPAPAMVASIEGVKPFDPFRRHKMYWVPTENDDKKYLRTGSDHLEKHVLYYLYGKINIKPSGEDGVIGHICMYRKYAFRHKLLPNVAIPTELNLFNDSEFEMKRSDKGKRKRSISDSSSVLDRLNRLKVRLDLAEDLYNVNDSSVPSSSIETLNLRGSSEMEV